jgi:hypothetical protein
MARMWCVDMVYVYDSGVVPRPKASLAGRINMADVLLQRHARSSVEPSAGQAQYGIDLRQDGDHSGTRLLDAP